VDSREKVWRNTTNKSFSVSLAQFFTLAFMRKKILFIGVAIVILLLAGFFIQRKFSPVENKTVSIENFTFAPSMVVIREGATITWLNDDTATHQIISDLFQSGNLKQSETFAYTFKKAGSYYYRCALTGLQGKVVVE